MQMTMKTQPKKTPTTLPNGQAAPDMGKMMWMMWYFMAFMMGSFAYSVASWVGLYLLTTTLFALVQFSIQRKDMLKVMWNAKFRKSDEPEIIE
jgi:membrane protein insertase Oxa1/YidC/SpoIIIJ